MIKKILSPCLLFSTLLYNSYSMDLSPSIELLQMCENSTAVERSGNGWRSELSNLLNSSGININIKNEEGMYIQTPLMWTLSNGSFEMAHMLIKAGADINIPDDDGMTPLMKIITAYNSRLAYNSRFANDGYDEILKFLLEHAKLKSKDFEGKTAYHWAAEIGVPLKLFKKIPLSLVDLQDNNGNAIIHHLCNNITEINHENTKSDIDFITSIGANPYLPDPRGLKPLKILDSKYDIFKNKIIQLNEDLSHLQQTSGLFGRGIIVYENGIPISNWEVQITLSNKNEELQNCEECVSTLRDAVRNLCYSKLHYKQNLPIQFMKSLYSNDSKMSLKLLKNIVRKKNLYTNSFNHFSTNPLHLTIKRNMFNVFKIVLNYNLVNPCAQDKHKRTPLHLACLRNNFEMVKLLLEQKNSGALNNMQDDQGQTPIHIAVQQPDERIAEILMKHWFAPEVYRRLGVNNADKYMDINGLTPIHLAYLQGNLNIAVKMISQNPELATLRDSRGSTPFSMAYEASDINFAQFLISKNHDSFEDFKREMAWKYGYNSDPNLVMESLLKINVRERQPEKIRFLVNLGARINQHVGNSAPIHEIAYLEYDYITTLDALLQNGANIHLLDKEGYTVFHTALIHNNTGIADSLLKAGFRITKQEFDEDYLEIVKDRIIHEGKVDFYDLFAKNGFDMMHSSQVWINAFDEVLSKEKFERAELMISSGIKIPTPVVEIYLPKIIDSIEKGETKLLKFFINKHIGLNSMKKGGKSLLRIAHEHNNRTATLLLSNTYKSAKEELEKLSNSKIIKR